MTASDRLRIDKFLWAARIYKTRGMAAEACKKGRIILDDVPVKASREVKTGDVILVRKLPAVYTFRIKKLIENRISARKVCEYIEDMTSIEELNKLRISDSIFYFREKGTGRPTKKERRILDNLLKE
ncbi:MAG: RNA-binding S4 domain-containing protein [Bacteroidales bacterium]|nr:RNA-binding S4 domain-containing protein [Bacteroidales bacterium]